jgi:hypothetical protein
MRSLLSEAGQKVGAILLTALLLTGCQAGNPFNLGASADTAAPISAVASPPAERPPDGLLEFIAGAAPGHAIVVQDPARGQWRVTMGREYFSAAGLTCRRFTMEAMASRQAAVRAACRDPSGWHLDAVALSEGMPLTR